MHELPEATRQELLNRTIELSPVGMMLVDDRGRIRMANGSMSRMFGYEDEALQMRPVEILLPAGQRKSHEAHRTAYLADPDVRLMGRGRDLTGIRADGTEFPVEVALTPIRLSDQQLVLAVVTDITERKRTELALKEREARLAAFMTHAQEGVSVLRQDGTILEVNPKMSEILGQDAHDLVGRNLLEFVRPASAEKVSRRIRSLADEDGGRDVGIELARSDGRVVIVDFSFSTVEVDGAPLVFSIARDVTKERQLERQFLQAQRLESIGRVAGGVAHDFNNILTVINGNAEMIAGRLPPDDRCRDDLGEIVRASQRAQALTRQLLAFSRQQVLEPKVFDLNQLIAGMEKMLHRVIGEDIELESRLDLDGGHVLADPGQIEQVLMNLIVNARDAIDYNGTITIETSRITLDQEYASRHADATPGPHIMLSVSDTGSGMTPEVQSRMFEPFFTTKESGRGTGLGLATVYGIVKQSGGHIWVYSELGEGTTFKVYLPRVAEDAESVPSLASPPLPRGGHETVLIVEDDASVRRLAVGMLEQKGYLVLTAENGRRALTLIGAGIASIHLLITDVVMPEMGGPELARNLRAKWPDLRVLYVSGYTDSTIARHGLTEGEAFLQKPFTSDSLTRRVREILDHPTAQTPGASQAPTN